MGKPSDEEFFHVRHMAAIKILCYSGIGHFMIKTLKSNKNIYICIEISTNKIYFQYALLRTKTSHRLLPILFPRPVHIIIIIIHNVSNFHVYIPQLIICISHRAAKLYCMRVTQHKILLILLHFFFISILISEC